MVEILKVAPMTPERCVLTCMVGLPYSGKSTVARRLSSENNIPIVCPDAIRVALHGQKFVGSAEPFIWAIAKTMVESLFLSGHTGVILDATNTTEARREEWVKPRLWQTEFHVIETSRENCLYRAGYMLDADIVPIIERMYEQFEPVVRDVRYSVVYEQPKEDHNVTP